MRETAQVCITQPEQQGVDVHEEVHVEQLQPYANQGWWGYLEAAWFVFRNAYSLEIPAYKAELNFLNQYPTSDLPQYLRDAIYYRSVQVRNNLQYNCSQVSGKPAGC
jgi:hypothetical protein